VAIDTSGHLHVAYFAGPGDGTQNGEIRYARGTTSVYESSHVNEGDASAGLWLHQNVPNPCNPATTIRFDLPESRWARLDIRGVDGRPVCRLVDARLPAGSHRATWDGRNVRGQKVASGTYFAQLAAGATRQTIRMTFVR
jgi:hypothetical protein